jgi:DNA-binding response OmpR family regulator
MLPGMNGLDVCKNIRMSNNEVPIIILTALNQTEDIVEAFDRDADDYLTKPFRLEELKARISRYSRKSKTVTEQKIYWYLTIFNWIETVNRFNVPILLLFSQLLNFVYLNF